VYGQLYIGRPKKHFRSTIQLVLTRNPDGRKAFVASFSPPGLPTLGTRPLQWSVALFFFFFLWGEAVRLALCFSSVLVTRPLQWSDLRWVKPSVKSLFFF